MKENSIKQTQKDDKSENQEFILTITSKNIIPSSKNDFDIDDLGLGDYYKPVDVYFENNKGEKTQRNRRKGEYTISNQTLPKLAMQIYEKEILALSNEDRLNFPICKYNPSKDMIRGIYSSIKEIKKARNTLEYMDYICDNNESLVIYSWNIFSTLYFVQECLKRWGKAGDKFVFTYRKKTKEELKMSNDEKEPGDDKLTTKYKNNYSNKLLESKNVILRGAPGTGKTYLAKQIAADIVSEGETDDYYKLAPDQIKQIAFVQFHPSYDYTDFVEGLRPVNSESGNVGFKLQDGVFTQFIKRARTNFENSKKDDGTLKKEKSVEEAISDFLENVDVGNSKFYSYSKNEFTIIDYDEEIIKIYIPNNKQANKLNLKISDIRKLLEADEVFEKMRDIQNFFKASYGHQAYTYYLTLYKEIRKLMTSNVQIKKEPLRKYIFIIDEINRGEISKIFGELFFSIDPGYRGKAGEVSTQYQNLHDDPNDKFYIPENVYIIGTMNDIDRSVDTFDFAMRRRFRFIEIKPESCVKMLDCLSLKDEAINRMKSLNKAIVETEGLNENYQIGPSYFLKLNEIDFDDLWADYLKPLLEEYIRGLSDEVEIMDRFEKAYNGADNESSEA